MVNNTVCRMAASLALTFFATHLNGAGFELPQRGMKEMGIAYGGSAALLEDASAVAHNPAGLIRLDGRQVLGGLTLLRSSFDYDTQVYRELVPGDAGQVPGPSSGAISRQAEVPHLYYVHRLSDESAFGLGLYVPFASTTKYPGQWAGRYHATETYISAINLSPAYAWRYSDQLAFGVAMVLQYFTGDFQNQIDVGYIAANEVIDSVSNRRVLGLNVELRDGPEGVINALAHQFNVKNEMEVNSWGYGFKFGLLWEPWAHTRIGVNYDSGINHTASGEARRPETLDPEFRQRLEDAIAATRLRVGALPVGTIGSQSPEEAVAGAAKAVGPLGAAGGDIELLVTMPETLTLSAYHQLSGKVAITGGVTWTNWSRLDELRFSYKDKSERGGSDITGEGEDVRRRDLVQPFRWQDTFRIGIGGIVAVSDAVTLRAGMAFDESPVPDAARRTPRGPDSDRTIFSVGGSWRISSRWQLDGAFSHTRFSKSRIDNKENPAGSYHRIEGSYQGELNTLGLQVNYGF